MIVVRDIFQLRFGQSKDGIALWRQALAALTKSGFPGDMRLLTDLAGGPYYTVILESTFDSLSAWESSHSGARDNSEWKSIYAKIVPLTESGRREILNIVE